MHNSQILRVDLGVIHIIDELHPLIIVEMAEIMGSFHCYLAINHTTFCGKLYKELYEKT